MTLPPRIPSSVVSASRSSDDAGLDPGDWSEVAAVHEVGAVMPRRVEIDGEGVLLCRSNGVVHAVAELCPHKGLSMAWGVLMDGQIMCPHHQYKFRLEDGACSVRRCEPLAVREVRVVEGRVWVRRRVALCSPDAGSSM